MVDVVAAGAVVGRKGRQVLLVHRPKYDDWSFPKGKLDPGEHQVTAAVREVAEETGLDIRLGAPLPSQRYEVVAGDKLVHYWAARVVGGDDVSTFAANDEVDEVAWVPCAEARERLTYAHDVETLDHWLGVRKKTSALVVLRHAKARGRRAWQGDDRQRPLTGEGDLQSEQLVPVLAAYGTTRVVTSSSVRCTQTVTPYADVADIEVTATDCLSEEDATAEGVRTVVDGLLGGSAVLCTHRPVLPHVLTALGLPAEPLEPGGLLVIHHRRARGGVKVVAVEHH